LLAVVTIVGSMMVTTAAAKSVSVMTYNVENLFDLTHDPQKNDYTFLPLAEKQRLKYEKHCLNIGVPAWKTLCLTLDWNRAALDSKMTRLADVITGKHPGHAPDVLIMQEVENVGVMRELSENFLRHEGYFPPILLEGSDYRGIDCGILSRFPLVAKPVLKPIPIVTFGGKRKESIRGILMATFRLSESELLTVFAVHLPSPQKSWKLRRQTIDYLNLLASKLPQNQIILAAGDFNNSSEEENRYGLFQKHVRPNWHISHLEGCKTCPGSHFHQSSGSWSFLDAIMLHKSQKHPWKIVAESVRIVRNPPVQVDTAGHPLRFSPLAPKGVSDHLPVILELRRTK
jgi:endonuclease/exonuclease/phosphatase family metal-dependent hydrolase